MPSNTPMTANSGPCSWRSPSTPSTTSITPSGIRRPRDREGIDQDLVGRQAAVPDRSDRDEATRPVADADRGIRITRGQRRADELAARDRDDLAIADDELRKRLEA